MDPKILRQLLDVGRQMAETHSLDPLLAYAMQAAITLFGAERGYLILLREDGGLDFRVRQDRQGHELAEPEEQISHTILERVIISRQPLLTEDAFLDPEFGQANSVKELQLRSLMCVPLIVREQVLGAIYLDNRLERAMFGPDDLQAVQIFAAQAAVAIENARLNDDMERRVAQRTADLVTAQQQLEQAVQREQSVAQLLEQTRFLDTDSVARILIVDDRPMNRDVLNSILTRAGYQVELAETGEAGLQAAQQLDPDVILLDIVLPDISGYDVCTRLKADARTAGIPVIFISVLEEIEHKMSAFAAGGVDYVTKPFHSKEVQARVRVHTALRLAQKEIHHRTEQLEREIAERHRAEEALRRLNETLEQRIIERTQSLRDEISERERAESSLHAMAARLAEVEEAERRRLAAVLHDQAGQNLTALGINLRILRAQLLAVVDDPATVDRLSTRLDDALSLVKETTRRIRYVMDDLRPPALEEYGLLAALRWYGESFASRTNIALTVHGPEPMPRLPHSTEMALFRIAQEALTNVSRHARAARVTVTVDVGLETVHMVIGDDGIGFDPAGLAGPGERPGWGLRMMVERADAVSGSCWIRSSPGAGTQVVVEAER